MSGKKIKRVDSKKSNSIKIGNQQVVTQSTQKETPIFCLNKIQKNYCLSKCEIRQKASLIDQLHALSQLTWQEIQAAHRHGLGCETINKDSLNCKVPLHMKDETLLALRYDGKKPFVGFRNGRIFHIVWIDRDFSLYPH